MSKLSAICCSLLLHVIFITGFVATGASATAIATDRASQVWTA